MRNRAKCKKCGTILESLNANDWIYCDCNEIGISGGKDNYRCFASDFSNFLRVDDEGNEVVVSVKPAEEKQSPTKQDLMQELAEMIKSIDGLPGHAKLTAINHYDYGSLLYLILALFKCR